LQATALDSLLTWRQCVSLTLQHNPELDASRYSVEASESSYKESRNGLSPQVALEQSYGTPTGNRDPEWKTSGALNVKLWNKTESGVIRTAKTLIPITFAFIENHPLQLLVTNLSANDYVGRMAVGRTHSIE